jgi:hypothetical protein
MTLRPATRGFGDPGCHECDSDDSDDDDAAEGGLDGPEANDPADRGAGVVLVQSALSAATYPAGTR